MSRGREQIILDFLEEHSSANVTELSHLLEVSDVTVRKTLEEMQKKGKLKRTWGGAVSLSSSNKELEHDSKAAKQILEKKAIAVQAYSMINDGDAVYMDSGSTNMELAKMIADGKKRLVVGTNAINIAMELTRNPLIEVCVTGGTLRTKAYSCVGPMAEQMMVGVCYDKGFVSTYRCSIERGLSTPNVYEASLKKCILKACKETYSLADHSKFGDDSMMQIAGVEELDYIITDWKIDPEIVKQFEELDVQLVVAQREE